MPLSLFAAQYSDFTLIFLGRLSSSAVPSLALFEISPGTSDTDAVAVSLQRTVIQRSHGIVACTVSCLHACHTVVRTVSLCCFLAQSRIKYQLARGGQIASRGPNVARHSVFSDLRISSGKFSNLKYSQLIIVNVSAEPNLTKT